MGIQKLLILIYTAAVAFHSVVRAQVRIYGGLPESIVKFPWQASVQVYSYHHCGGSIISKEWILSAAHCYSSSLLDVEDLSVRVGSSWHANGGQIIKIDRIVNHPKYHFPAYDYDFSLLHLSETLKFNDVVQPIDLPDEHTEIPDGTLCITTGWGETLHINESDDFIRKVSVPIVNKDECQKAHIHPITDRMICAGYELGGRDSCQGDSGGPLRFQLEKTAKLNYY